MSYEEALKRAHQRVLNGTRAHARSGEDGRSAKDIFDSLQTTDMMERIWRDVVSHR